MTTRIQVSDTGLEVIPPRDALTQGSDNTLTLEFEFSGAWLECNEINAVFTDSINSATTPVTGGACVIPVEVLQNPWRFVSISLNGTSASGVITSPFVRIGQVLPSASGGEGGKFVTMAQLMEILQGYVKAEDLGIYVTHDELQAALETYAKQADIDRLDEVKADKTTVAALASTVAAQGVAIENKADAATVTALETRVGTNETNIATVQRDKADKTQLADYWSKSEIGLQTDGDGKKYLANDGKYYDVQGGGGDAKTFIAEYNVTSAQEIIAFLDASKEPFAPMLVKRGADYYTVTTAAKQDADKVIIRTFATLSGNYYMFQYTITGSTWATASYGFQKLLESGTNIKTINGQSLLGSGDIPIQGGTQEQADWNQTDDTSPAYIKNKPTIPDVSGLATQASVDAVSDTVSTIETRVDTNETNITALQTDKAEKTAVQALADEVAGKASDADLQAAQAAIAANTAAIATKADGDALDALSAAVADKANAADVHALSDIVDGKADESALADYWSKQEIGLQTAGTGTLFLADDGTYKPAAGDPPDLSAYLTKTEAEGTYADKVSMLTLENTVDAQAARIGTNETNISALQTEIAGKASDADLQALSARVDANETNIATNTAGIAANVTALAAIDGRVGVNETNIAALQTDIADKADAATVSAIETRVGTNETNITALQTDKADASALADYETTAHASATYETKADASKIKSVTAAGFSVAPDSAGNVNIGGTMVSRDATSGSWGSEITYQIAQTLPAGATPGTNPTPGASLTIVKRTENSGANPRVSMTIDGVQVATSADIPDVSHFATVDYVQNTYESTAHASATYAKKTDIITVTDGDGKSFLANDGTYKVPSLDGVVKEVVQILYYEGGFQQKWRELTPDANGTLEIQTAHASYSFGNYDGYGIHSFAICDCMVGQEENPYVMEVSLKGKSNVVDSFATIVMEKWESGSMSTLGSLDVPSIYMLDNRIATATTDMATQTWVQNYIASLDGTNMKF